MKAIHKEQLINTAMENSYRNYHAKGLDYLCISRTNDLVRKVYFFDGDTHSLNPVVSPHDHRYAFFSKVLCGAIENTIYHEKVDGEIYNKFNWNTPLNGGDGFQHNCETRLKNEKPKRYNVNQSYHMRPSEIHTVQIRQNQTVLYVEQYADEVSIKSPTSTYMSSATEPSLDGLYDRFTTARLIERLDQIYELAPGLLKDERNFMAVNL